MMQRLVLDINQGIVISYTQDNDDDSVISEDGHIDYICNFELKAALA